MEKKVLLFSGGFDSILQEYLIKPDVLLYVDMKTSYSKRELEALQLLPESYKSRLVIIDVPLGIYERENKYLPYRNLILATMAMQYGQHVYFGFNASDDAPDKDNVFIKRLTTLFRQLNKNAVADMGWDNKKFSFLAPYRHLTKTEMVREAIESGMSPEIIKHTRTCYDSDSVIGCGNCTPCINKAVALINNFIFEGNLFDSPITDEKLRRRYMEAKENVEIYNIPKRYAEEFRQARFLLQQKR